MIEQDIRTFGYLYFVYSNNLKTIYVGESEDTLRINVYQSILDTTDNFERVRLYNFYTKHKTINTDLAQDLVNRNNEFKIHYIHTQKYKVLEKSYIKYLKYLGYNLYNKKLYKKWQILDTDIDKNIIDLFAR